MASNQVLAEGFRVFVVQPGLKLPEVVINPTWREVGDHFALEEGCLSVPELGQCVMRRFHEVELQWYDRDGTHCISGFTGLEAQIAQHECDHLDGKLLLDSLPKNLQARLRAEVVRMRKKGK